MMNDGARVRCISIQNYLLYNKTGTVVCVLDNRRKVLFDKDKGKTNELAYAYWFWSYELVEIEADASD